MFFPWVGLFEQIRLADIFVHFNDVQLPQGRSFTNRVQIKTKDGSKWLTVPLKKTPSGALINQTPISYDSNWVSDHLKFLENNYAKAPYKEEMLQLVTRVYNNRFELISELDIFAVELVCDYFGISRDKEFLQSAPLHLQTKKSEKLLDIITGCRADKYITGWGALNYLDYELFERKHVEVEYMDYKKNPYNQGFGQFDPFVSILDLIAYEGKDGSSFICSSSKNWKTFIYERNRSV